MTDQPNDPAQRPPTEDELRAAYEAELKALRVEDVVVQTVVSLLNLGARKAGLVPGTEDELDLGQTAVAIESCRALLPVIEPALGEDAGALRDALSQLQIAYAQQAGQPAGEQPGTVAPGAAAPAGEGQQQPAEPGDGPAQRSGRLWVPGQ